MKNEFKITKGYLIPITIIISASAVCITLIIGLVSKHNTEVNAEVAKHNAEVNAEVARRNAELNVSINNTAIIDKFTHCLQTVMSESTKVNKPVSAKEAKEICSELSPK